jgi:hypothetical protein
MKSSVLNRDLVDLVSAKSERLRIFLGIITGAHENLHTVTLKSFLMKFSATQYCGRSGSTSVVFREMVDVLRAGAAKKFTRGWRKRSRSFRTRSKHFGSAFTSTNAKSSV